jgi:hypothetical protein
MIRCGSWLLLGITVCAGGTARAQSEGMNFLFYGNSFTNYWNVPGLVGSISTAAGNPAPNIENAAVDSMTLGWHLQNNTAVISSPRQIPHPPGFHWDALILQEYSTLPTHIGDPAAFRSNASALLNLVRQSSPSVLPVLYETWARGPGNSMYPGSFPGPDAMQQELRDNYQLARTTLDGISGHGRTRVAPVGDGFQLGSWQGLYDWDIYHANRAGGLLAALTLYGTIYRDTVSDVSLGSITTNLQLTASDGQRLKSLADAAIAANLSVADVAAYSSSFWNGSASGNWSSSTNWSSGAVPSGSPAAAYLGPTISRAASVNVDSARTVQSLTLDSPLGYTIGGSSALTLASSSGQSMLKVASGNHVISAPMNAQSDVLLSTAGASGISISGTLTAAGQVLTKTGAGSVQVQTLRAAALNVVNGAVKLAAKSDPTAPQARSIVGGLFIASGASADLTNNTLIIDSPGPAGAELESVRRSLFTGRLISSTTSGATRLGYADSLTLNLPQWAGVSSADSIAITPALAGDTNLDGKVDILDLSALAAHWQRRTVWTGGDLNYDGIVNQADLGLLAGNWQRSAAAPPAIQASQSLADALAALGLPTDASIPEPACLIFAAALALPLRRRPRIKTSV